MTPWPMTFLLIAIGGTLFGVLMGYALARFMKIDTIIIEDVPPPMFRVSDPYWKRFLL